MGKISHTPWTGTITASSGTASVTLPFVDGIIKQIRVQAATSSTTFDVVMTDINSIDTVEQEANTGLLNDTSETPIYGPMTLTVNNASADEAFTYLVICRDR